MKISDSVKKLEGEVVDLRRALHKIPEEGFKEYKTSKFIEDYFKTLKVDEMIKTAQTGWIAVFKGANPKKTYGFRADMDGLSVMEDTGADFASSHTGYMHACGHDGHMSVVLGLAKWISDHKELLQDNIVMIFQPAEEGPGGAEVIVEEGILEAYHLDGIFGLHLFPDLDQGVFGIKQGPIMAMTSEFDIEIHGKSAHGAKPHKGVDSIIIAANLLQGIQQIVSRRIDPIDPVVITVGRIEGGERRNVIAAKARLEGTMRGFSVGTFDRIEEELLKLFNQYELLYGCKVVHEFRRLYPPVINDEQLCSDFMKVSGGECQIVQPQMLAEDFSFFNKLAPCLFFFLGTKNIDKEFTHGLHHQQFNFEETVLLNAIQAYVNLLSYYDSIEAL